MENKTHTIHGDNPVITIKWVEENGMVGFKFVRHDRFYGVIGDSDHQKKWQPFLRSLKVGNAYSINARYVRGRSMSGANFIPEGILIEHPSILRGEQFQKTMYDNIIAPNLHSVETANRGFSEVRMLADLGNYDSVTTRKLMTLPKKERDSLINEYEGGPTEDPSNGLLSY